MNTKRLFFLLALTAFVLSGSGLWAQNTIKGSVTDTDGSPIEFATVALLKGDSSVVTGCVTDDKGLYSISLTNGGEYLLRVSFIGLSTEYRSISLGKRTLTLDPIVLRAESGMLQTVQITAKRPIIEQQIDKLVMNVAQSAFANGNNALDLLRKAPGVTIDKDGNVMLNGQGVQVWIDGRPSQLDGKALEALLRGTAGTSIDKIEIIANPSAKYDAEGQGGIINIKTRRTLAQGFNGSLSAEAGGMTYSRGLEQTDPLRSSYLIQGVDLNLNYRGQKTNTYLQLSESTNPMGTDVHSETHSTVGGHTFDQESFSLFDAKIPSYSLKVGNDWFIDSKNTLGAIFTMPITRMHQWSDTNYNRSMQSVDGLLSQQAMSYSSTDYRMMQMMGNVNFTHVFDESKANEITANLDYLHNASLSDNDLYNYYLNPLNPIDWSRSIDSANSLVLHSDYKVDIYSAKVDWQRVVNRTMMLEAGAKWALSKTDNEMTYTFDTYLPTLSNTREVTPFDYTEHIGALYASIGGQINKNWSAKAGLRGEYTYAFNSTNTVKQDYMDLFPTLFAGYNSDDYMKRFNLSYTRRINRPNYQQLNPFESHIDAHTSNMGNPDLKPAYIDAVSLSAGFGQYVTLNANMQHTKDMITYTPLINLENGDQVLYADNFGSTTMWGGGLTLSELPLGKQFSLLLNAVAYDIVSTSPTTSSLIVGQAGSSDTYRTNSFYGTAYGCLTWALESDWKVQLDGWVSSPVAMGYMRNDWNYSSNISVKKSAFDNRLVFTASFNDIFRSMSHSFSVVGANGITSHFEQRYMLQKVSVGLQWNFGAAQKALKHRNVGNLDEAGRTGNSKI